MTDALIITGMWLAAVYMLSKGIEVFEDRRVTPFYSLVAVILFLVIGISSDDVASGYAGFGMFIFSCIIATLTQIQVSAAGLKK